MAEKCGQSEAGVELDSVCRSDAAGAVFRYDDGAGKADCAVAAYGGGPRGCGPEGQDQRDQQSGGAAVMIHSSAVL